MTRWLPCCHNYQFSKYIPDISISLFVYFTTYQLQYWHVRVSYRTWRYNTVWWTVKATIILCNNRLISYCIRPWTLMLLLSHINGNVHCSLLHTWALITYMGSYYIHGLLLHTWALITYMGSYSSVKQSVKIISNNRTNRSDYGVSIISKWSLNNGPVLELCWWVETRQFRVNIPIKHLLMASDVFYSEYLFVHNVGKTFEGNKTKYNEI